MAGATRTTRSRRRSGLAFGAWLLLLVALSSVITLLMVMMTLAWTLQKPYGGRRSCDGLLTGLWQPLGWPMVGRQHPTPALHHERRQGCSAFSHLPASRRQSLPQRHRGRVGEGGQEQRHPWPRVAAVPKAILVAAAAVVVAVAPVLARMQFDGRQFWRGRGSRTHPAKSAIGPPRACSRGVLDLHARQRFKPCRRRWPCRRCSFDVF
mmetsp:Transcript_41728/g.73351  ORF Transcript_41728/g.73351 Transcript_41728/m.73351 type:complete len:208 (-) Transcript_41728:1335-1958(-)